MTGRAEDKDPNEKELPARPEFIPVIDESNRLTGLMDQWELQGQQGEGERGRQAENGGAVPSNLEGPEQTEEEASEREKEKAPPPADTSPEVEVLETGEKEKGKGGPAIPPRARPALLLPGPPLATLASPPLMSISSWQKTPILSMGCSRLPE